MNNEEKDFIDGLAEDFASAMEMKAAIEVSRDKNGEIDNAKATGISMGLGHTHDNDIAMMGALLGAEGVFDDDNNTNVNCANKFDNGFTLSSPIINTTVRNTHATKPMAEWDYEGKKAEIVTERKYKTGLSITGLFLVTIFFLYMMGSSSPEFLGAYLFLMLVIDGFLGCVTYYINRNSERELADIEYRYSVIKRIEKEKKEKEQVRNELKNHAGSNKITDVVKQIRNIMKILYNTADQASGITEPTFSEDMINTFLSSLIYFAIKECDIVPGAKAPLFDYILSKLDIITDFNGNILFCESQVELDEMLNKLVNETFTNVVIAAYKFSNPNDFMNFTKTACSLMLLLDEEIKNDISYVDFGNVAVPFILNVAKKATQRVIDERLID